LLDLGQGKEQRPIAIVEGYRANELVIAAPGAKTVIIDDATASNTTTESSANADNRGADNNGAVNLNSNAPPSLEGTTWNGSTPEADFTIAFLKDGKITYTIKATKRSVGGTWKQVGNVIRVNIGGYSVVNGNMENGVIKMEGVNVEGTKFNYTLFPTSR
jgi:hypothetical protein